MVKLGYSNYYWLKQDRLNRQREKQHVHETRSITLSNRVQSETSDDQSRERQFQEVRCDDRDQRRDVQRSESGMRDRRELDKHADQGSRRSLKKSRFLRHAKTSEDVVQKRSGDTKKDQSVRDEGSSDDKGNTKACDTPSDL